MRHIMADYLSDSFSYPKLQEYATELSKLLRPHRRKFDTIAFRGVSGALVAPILAHKMKKDLISVRKNTDDSHVRPRHKIEGNIGTESYIIVDDFICTGNTIQAIANEVYDWQAMHGFEGHCYAVVCYRASRYDGSNDTVIIRKKDNVTVLCTPLYIVHYHN